VSEPLADRSAQPFASLQPEHLLDALDSIGLRADGRLLALNSYENRVYLVYADDASYVVKFYRPGRWSDAQILEEHAFLDELVEAEVPAVAPLRFGQANASLHTYQDLRFTVFPRRGGRSPETEDMQCMQWIGRFIGRIHSVGAQRNFVVRPSVSIEAFGEASLASIRASGFVPKDLHAAYFGTVDQAIDVARERITAIGGKQGLAAFGWQRIYGDCHIGNILWTPSGPHFVDLDDARTGPPVQDLWMLLGGDVQNNREEAQTQLGALVRGYEEFREFDDVSLALIEPLRTLRLLHYSAWLTQRWADPAFPAAFPWFNTARYWQDKVLELREQIAAMHEPPLRVSP
jgi:Ser/Thr protein kinase RdoA (MazF antagonist)